MRGALHLHRAADMPLLAAGLRLEDGRDLAQQSGGPFATELAAAGVRFGDALDEVATVMRAAVPPGQRPTKGELSGAISGQVDERLAPWCEGCGALHVQDQLFRMATLQAGLEIELDHESPSRFRYVAGGGVPSDGEPESARAELVRRFLAAFGPARPAHLAAWLALTPAAARRWWDLVAGEVDEVTVDGDRLWVHWDDVDALHAAKEPSGVRLLPPYDPVTELADRKLLVPDSDNRRAVWRAAANPGVLLIAGEIAGIWRQRRARSRLAVRIEPFGQLTARHREAVKPDAATIARFFGAADAELTFA
jgi:hypothetical protein